MRITEVALVQGGHVVAYPEGRVGLTADGWPERGRTGMARMALGLGVPVIPVSQWGAHEVLQYGNDWGKLRTAVRGGRCAVRRSRCTSGRRSSSTTCRWAGSVDATAPGTASPRRSPAGWSRCRAGEADRPHYVDRTRPTTAVAAYPGGVVPDDIP